MGYQASQQQIQKMNDKLAVVKNLFDEDFNKKSISSLHTTGTPRSNTSTVGTEADALTPKYAQQKTHRFPPPQHNNNNNNNNNNLYPMQQRPQRQTSAPINNHQLKPHPINH